VTGEEETFDTRIVLLAEHSEYSRF